MARGGPAADPGVALARAMRVYWAAHPAKVRVGPEIVPGSPEYFAVIDRHHAASFARSNRLIDWSALAGRTVLDVYCGLGVDAVALARAGARVISVATAPAHAALTRRYAEQEGVTIAIVVADPARLPVATEACDLVLARGVLMFTPALAAAIQEIRRVQRAGGRFIAHLYNRWSWYPLFARVARVPLVQEPEDPPYLRLDSARVARRAFASFQDLCVVYDRYPRRSAERSGLAGRLFNRLVVPPFQVLPAWLVRPLGFYVIIAGRKG